MASAPETQGRGRDRGPIRLGVKNEVYDFVGGSTRVFTLR